MEFKRANRNIENITNSSPISKYKAFQIANQKLKDEFSKQTNVVITYLNFTDYDIKLITHHHHKYWYIKIKDADFSWYDNDTLYDGCLTEEDLQKLQCYIAEETGTYYRQLPEN